MKLAVTADYHTIDSVAVDVWFGLNSVFSFVVMVMLMVMRTKINNTVK